MYSCPKEPRTKAREAPESEIGYRKPSAYNRQVALVPIPELAGEPDGGRRRVAGRE
ncbi:MAG: hypothetical protein JWO91_3931 [Acidobacteriaceae bacterium]|nr:hypothetical protein [Acidobacteriaceae bacterium]